MDARRTAEKITRSAEELEKFASDLDAIRKRVGEEVGEPDARYLRRVVVLQRSAEIGGRAMLFAGILPPLWIAGVALLGLSKILENMEIGHNVIHGQYDWMNDPVLNSACYEWDVVCPAEHWKKTHNYEHHTFTSILGKDRDVGYGFLRVAEEQPWRPMHLVQPLYALGVIVRLRMGHRAAQPRVRAGACRRKAPARDAPAVAAHRAQGDSANPQRLRFVPTLGRTFRAVRARGRRRRQRGPQRMGVSDHLL